MKFRAFGLSALLLLAGCAASSIAPADATLSRSPDAPGYMIVGLAERNSQRDIGAVTQFIRFGFNNGGGKVVSMLRYSCGSIVGFYGSKPCNLAEMDRYVLTVPPGDWRAVGVVENLKIILGQKVLQDDLPPYRPVHVGPGEIVYVGDFTFATNYEAQEIKLVSHAHDDNAARAALAAYPGLFNAPIVYRDPTQKP